ncbi:putative permease HI1015 [Fibrisoma limi BUZ 3]|uniref:Putative permease HI1015 n=1 Tax=Fibrisoma limi BUZ 3 TaxID=1185876 RepID=I2GPJ9_9BACT|nr:SLC13 family permease [Fibrisoma limi]CCH55827.1 putative permease HI1015 [Fibrisoma limi BUZ 3]
MNPIWLLLGSIAAIILLSSRVKLHTFLVLIVLSAGVGLLAGMKPEQVMGYIRTGFGETMGKIGLLIVFGTILGSLLDRTNATLSIATFLLNRVGQHRTPLAVTLMGFVIGLPIFCDSGFIVLSGLVIALIQRLGHSHVRLVLCLAGSLYGLHCLVPPHPGITAAVGILNADIGRMILLGSVLAIPPTVVAYAWAKLADSRTEAVTLPITTAHVAPDADVAMPSVLLSFLAILIPIALIAVKPIVLLNPTTYPAWLTATVNFAGDPLVALSVGIAIALSLFQKLDKALLNTALEDAIVKAGPILIIIGAGGAFGEVIKHIGLETYLTGFAQQSGAGRIGANLWLPFLLTVLFKTAQGSSTVAVISVASLVQPLLGHLGVQTDWDRLLVLAAMGAGSMTLSHANDAYFWVVSRFGQLDTTVTLRTYSVMSLLMSLTTFLVLLLVQALV